MSKVIVAPSLLSADFANLSKEIALVEKSKATWLHFDVMDGHFVPNISFGSKVLADVGRVSELFLDVHLMISDPLFYADDFIKAGADLITFHIEAYNDLNKIRETIDHIRNKGVKVGVSIKPLTPVSSLLSLLDKIDLVLVMSVEPGFGGQKFKEEAVSKIRDLVSLRKERNLNYLIEVDGGIDSITAKRCRDAGVDVLVAGSYLFGHNDLKERVELLLND